MKMPILKIKGYSASSQVTKIKEEYDEFLKAMPGTRSELSEALDIIQSTLTYIFHTFDEDEIKSQMERHYKKLAERGHKITGDLHLKINSPF